MSIPIQPLSTYVVAQADKQPSKTASGIYLPESATEKSDIVTVKAVAKDVKTVKIGDKIVCKSYSLTNIKVSNQEFSLVKEEDILAVVTN
ncbi:co-chaperone GroES [Candidatus Saccharibacteria bacterium]|nr:co-chaperone GroES [Candidatus Saccharibacteria bacterium]